MVEVDVDAPLQDIVSACLGVHPYGSYTAIWHSEETTRHVRICGVDCAKECAVGQPTVGAAREIVRCCMDCRNKCVRALVRTPDRVGETVALEVVLLMLMLVLYGLWIHSRFRRKVR